LCVLVEGVVVLLKIARGHLRSLDLDQHLSELVVDVFVDGFGEFLVVLLDLTRERVPLSDELVEL
jgi:hypothetical protein